MHFRRTPPESWCDMVEHKAERKILPFSMDAVLKTYSYYGNFLGILQGASHDIRGITYNHFILLAFLFKLDFLFFPAGFPGGRKVRKCFNRETMSRKTNDFIQYIKSHLTQDKYAIVILNAKNLSSITFDREWYHEWMIYGYDDEIQSFYAVGTVVDTSCHAFLYRKILIPYNDFLLALPPADAKLQNYHRSQLDKCYSFYWLPENYIPEPVNLRKIKRNIFLFSHNFLPLCFNAKIYRKYAMCLRLYHQKNEKLFDLRPLKILQEHKNLVLQMMRDIVPNSVAAQEYQSIIKISNTIQVAALKFNMTKRNKQRAINTICDALYKLREKEPGILKQFYKEMKGMNFVE